MHLAVLVMILAWNIFPGLENKRECQSDAGKIGAIQIGAR